jgi:hypothetical protein
MDTWAKNPTPCSKHKAQSRRVTCEFYSSCLNFAVSRNWLNFTCLECQAFVETKLPIELCRCCEEEALITCFSDGRVQHRKTRISDTLDLDECFEFFQEED